VGKKLHLVSGTFALLLLSFANLCLLALPTLYRISQPVRSPEQLPRWTTWSGSLALALAFTSQVLFLAYLAAALFRWMQFYPGNPIQNFAIRGGLALSVGAFVTALFGAGPSRYAGVLSSVVTAGLWLLSAVASVAV
jgi:hypothetical protein